MKNLFTGLVFLIIMKPCFAQDFQKKDVLKEIRTKYQTTVQGMESYSHNKVELPNNNFEMWGKDTVWLEGPIEHIDYYSDSTEIKLLTYIREGSEGRASEIIEQFYLDEGELYFLFRKKYSISYSQSSESYLTEWRAYFHNKEVIRLLKKELIAIGGRKALDSISTHTKNKEVETSAVTWLDSELEKYMDIVKTK